MRPARSRAPVVEAERVTRRFGTFTAVDGVDLDVAAGEVVGLLGANGAGKTTLITMLLGLQAPTAGAVRLFGRAPGREQRRRVGYVPQHLGLYPDLTVAENLEFRAEVFGAAARRPPADLDGDRLVGELPLGLQRRAAFTAALQHAPDVLVLDEPTSGVSPLARSELWGLVRAEAERGAAVLVSTHYMDEAVQADRLVVLASGRVVARGTTADVVGDRTTLVVTTDRWAPAFDALDRSGWRVVLAGRTIRVPLGPGGDGRAVSAALDAAGIVARVHVEPATLEEAMVELSA